MNYLQLCQKVASDCGTVAGVPSFTTTVGNVGRPAQVCGWVADAWLAIQNERTDWLWMRKKGEAPLVIGQMEYTGAELGLTDWRHMLRDMPGYQNISLFDPAIGRANESVINQIDPRTWRERYDRGVHDPNRPTEWATDDTGKFVVGKTPDKAYTIRFKYRTTPQILVADLDTPAMPDEFHLLIVSETIRLMSISDEAFQVLAPVAQQYQRLRGPLVNSQTPDVQFGGGSLA